MAIKDIINQAYQIIIQKSATILPKTIFSIIFLIVSYIIISLVDKAVRKLFDRIDFERTIEVFIEHSITTVLWILAIVMLLGNLGVNVAGFIAGLGIAGFVIGFALKDTLGNLASGIFLLIHQPFRIKDYVEIAGGIGGTIQSMGIAACVLYTPDNKQITVQNSQIWENPIINFTGLNQRRIEINVGISYDDDIGKAMKILHVIVNKDKRVLKNPEPMIGVKELGDSSVNLIARPWVKTSDYWETFFDLNKKIKEGFDKNNISIPFPQTDIHLKIEDTKKIN